MNRRLNNRSLLLLLSYVSAGCSPWIGSPSSPQASAADAETAVDGGANASMLSALPAPPPSHKADASPILPPRHRSRLPNGTEISVVSRPQTGLVSLHAVFLADLHTPRDRRMAAWAMEFALQGALAPEDRETFASPPTVHVTNQAVHVALSVLPSQADEGLAWLSQVIQTPKVTNFEAFAWQLQRRELRSMRSEPRWLATYLHDVGIEGIRTNASHPVLQRPPFAECQRWQRLLLKPSHTHLIVTGAIDPERLTRLFEEKFRGWKETSHGPTAPPQAPPPKPPREVRLADAPGASFAHLRLSFLGPQRGDGHPERTWLHLKWGQLALSTPERPGSGVQRVPWTALGSNVASLGDRWHLHFDLVAPAERLVDVATTAAHNIERGTASGFSEAELADAAHKLRAHLRRQFMDPATMAHALAWLIEHGFDETAFERELTVLSPDPSAVHATWMLQPIAAGSAAVTVVGDASRLERALSSWREVLVFDPKRELRFLRRVTHDPSASREVPSPGTEEPDDSP